MHRLGWSVPADLQLRVARGTQLHGLPAAGAEAAARRRVGRGGHVALEADLVALATQLGVRHRHRGEQRLGVRVHRAAVDLVLVAELHHAAQVHHGHAVGDVAHHREVVGDEDVGEPQLVLEVLHQVHHLRLHRHVERRDRLVADDDLGVQGQAAGDADALALTTGELVRVAVDVLRVEAHQVDELLDARRPLAAGEHVGVDAERLGDDVAHRHARVQGGVRVLQHHLDVAAHLTELAGVEGRDVPTLVEELTLGGLLQGHDEAPERGLATAGLTHHAQGLAAVEVEVHTIDGADVAVHALEDTLGQRVVPLQPTPTDDGGLTQAVLADTRGDDLVDIGLHGTGRDPGVARVLRRVVTVPVRVAGRARGRLHGGRVRAVGGRRSGGLPCGLGGSDLLRVPGVLRTQRAGSHRASPSRSGTPRRAPG